MWTKKLNTFFFWFLFWSKCYLKIHLVINDKYFRRFYYKPKFYENLFTQYTCCFFLKDIKKPIISHLIWCGSNLTYHQIFYWFSYSYFSSVYLLFPEKNIYIGCSKKSFILILRNTVWYFSKLFLNSEISCISTTSKEESRSLSQKIKS